MEKAELKKLFQTNLNETSKLPVPEHILHEKWLELNSINWTAADKQKMWEVRQSIWDYKSPEDYLALEPEVIVADSKVNAAIWTMLRRMTSTAKWSQSPGRFGKFLVRDKKTGLYLGVISIGSDFIAIGGRDSYIGWTTKHKMDLHKLNHVCMGSSIVPTQPLGSNFTGGKLLALLTASEVIEDFWNSKYPEKLAGVTTTSLFGDKGMSQYTGLHAWHQCQFSTGKVSLEPSEHIYAEIKDWARVNYPNEFNALMKSGPSGPPSHARPRLLALAHKHLGVKTVNSNFTRGVYFCELFKNTNAFLRNEEPELGERKFDNSVKTLSDIWKQRYARKRIAKLVKEERNDHNILFYDSLIGMSWDDAKAKFLADVGR